MGPAIGGIDSHLAATREAVATWLQNEQPIPLASNSVDATLLTLSIEEEAPEQPEVLSVLRQSRRLGVPAFNGSYQDWPYIATLELNACIDAEQEHKDLLLYALKALAENQGSNPNANTPAF